MTMMTIPPTPPTTAPTMTPIFVELPELDDFGIGDADETATGCEIACEFETGDECGVLFGFDWIGVDDT